MRLDNLSSQAQIRPATLKMGKNSKYATPQLHPTPAPRTKFTSRAKIMGANGHSATRRSEKKAKNVTAAIARRGQLMTVMNYIPDFET